MSKYLYAICLLLCSAGGYCQGVHGKWVGKASFEVPAEGSTPQNMKMETHYMEYELELIQQGDQVLGLSWSKFDNEHARTHVQGTYLNNILSLKETDLIEESASNPDVNYWCYFDMTLQVEKNGATSHLRGRYRSFANLDGSSCGDGVVDLALDRSVSPRRKTDRGGDDGKASNQMPANMK